MLILDSVLCGNTYLRGEHISEGGGGKFDAFF